MKRYTMNFLEKPFRSQGFRWVSTSVSTFNILFPHLSIQIKGVQTQALPHFVFCMIVSVNESIPHFQTKEAIFFSCALCSLVLCSINLFFYLTFYLSFWIIFSFFFIFIFPQRLLFVCRILPSPLSSTPASCLSYTPITFFLIAYLLITCLFIACLCHLLIGPTCVACLLLVISNLCLCCLLVVCYLHMSHVQAWVFGFSIFL